MTNFIITWNRKLAPAQLAHLEAKVKAVDSDAEVVPPMYGSSGYVAIDDETPEQSHRKAIYDAANGYFRALDQGAREKKLAKARKIVKRKAYSVYLSEIGKQHVLILAAPGVKEYETAYSLDDYRSRIERSHRWHMAERPI